MQRPLRSTAFVLVLAAVLIWRSFQGQDRGAFLPVCSVAMGQEVAKPLTVAQQSEAIAKEFNGTANGYLRPTSTEEDRKQAVERADKLTLKLLELAENNLKDPAALDLLAQVIMQEYWLNNYTSHPGWGKESPQAKALALLERDFLQSDKIAECCRRVHYCFRPECERFLRSVLEKSPHHEIQGVTCLYLVQFLGTRLDKLELLKNQPDLVDRYETVFGKVYIESLRQQDRTEVLKEIEALYTRAIDQFGDVKLPYSGTVAEQAKIELVELRELAVGKVAPEIEGVDQDGQQFKLSDYRGKVVLLYFWSEY
jgi:hypothetical protein